MDVIDKIALDLTLGAKKNFDKHGFVAPVVFIVENGTLNLLPQNLINLMTSDKEQFHETIRALVKKRNPLAVAIISEVWYLDLQGGAKIEQPSKSKDKKECVFVTVDSKEKQISYMAEIKDKKLGEWIKHPVFIKKGGEVEVSGNMIDFYGTSNVLNVPLEMHQKSKGGVDVPKIE